MKMLTNNSVWIKIFFKDYQKEFKIKNGILIKRKFISTYIYIFKGKFKLLYISKKIYIYKYFSINTKKKVNKIISSNFYIYKFLYNFSYFLI